MLRVAGIPYGVYRKKNVVLDFEGDLKGISELERNLKARGVRKEERQEKTWIEFAIEFKIRIWELGFQKGVFIQRLAILEILAKEKKFSNKFQVHQKPILKFLSTGMGLGRPWARPSAPRLRAARARAPPSALRRPLALLQHF
ncbi:hypothetical protein LR48_Vigan503s003000 [Vigna angularis]|uniref:Uncharacterized protein n=1 Tax=Phaseolus angularis TaxID=3914 RepID=A0A0L9TC09_PHAAN|nr:hypothetical protein LR48_Vigan503s003000 [Vigna angularis]